MYRRIISGPLCPVEENLTTRLVYDRKRHEAFYLDSNGPTASTTPEKWRSALKCAMDEMRFDTTNFFMEANPQALT